MAKSSAYQLSSFYPGTWSESYAPYFARHFARRLTAEEAFDAITRATNVGASIPVSGGMPNVTLGDAAARRRRSRAAAA